VIPFFENLRMRCWASMATRMMMFDAAAVQEARVAKGLRFVDAAADLRDDAAADVEDVLVVANFTSVSSSLPLRSM